MKKIVCKGCWNRFLYEVYKVGVISREVLEMMVREFNGFAGCSKCKNYKKDGK